MPIDTKGLNMTSVTVCRFRYGVGGELDQSVFVGQMESTVVFSSLSFCLEVPMS